MDTLRHIRIAEISKYDLAYANESLTWAKDKLEELKSREYEGNIPKELFLDIHLTADDIYLIEQRISYLLDKQLDDYHASTPSYSWDKKEACRLLKEVVDVENVTLPLSKLINVLHSSLWRIDRNDKLEALKNICVILGTEGHISITRAKELLEECSFYE